MGVIFILAALTLLVAIVVRTVKHIIKKEEKKIDKKTKIMIALTFVFIIMGGLTTPDSNALPEDLSEISIEEYSEHIVTHKLGEEADDGVLIIDEIKLNDSHVDYNQLIISLNKDVGLTANSTRDSALIDTKDLIQSIVEEYEFDGGILFKWSAPLTDDYGNEEYHEIMKMEFTPNTLSEINYENISKEAFREIADDAKFHPSIQ